MTARQAKAPTKAKPKAKRAVKAAAPLDAAPDGDELPAENAADDGGTAAAFARLAYDSAKMAMDLARGPGRPTDFKPEYVEQARKLTELGATDADLAEFFGVSDRTIYRWSANYAEFCQALKLGKAQADGRVERSLFHRAVGYTRDAVKIFMPAGALTPVIVPYREHVPPDTTAAIFWLKNRDKANWRDRQELTGADGAPLLPEDASTPEVANARRANALMALLAKMQAEAVQPAPADEAVPAAKAAKPRKAKQKTS